MRYPQNIRLTRKSTPSEYGTSISKIATFRGLDLGHTAQNVDITRSPDAKNMIRDEIGQVRKRMGYHTIANFISRINGSFYFKDRLFIHSGTNLIDYTDNLILGSMADNLSTALVISGKVYILDGVKLRVLEKVTRYILSKGGQTIVDATYLAKTQAPKTTFTYDDGVWKVDEVEVDLTEYGITVSGTDNFIVTTTEYSLATAESKAATPITYISRYPDGGGTFYRGWNLIGNSFENDFIVTSSYSSTKKFQLSEDNLDQTPPIVKVLNNQGEWITKTYSTDFNVDYTTGAVTFVTAPGTTPVEGVDNVKIIAYKTKSDKPDLINKCTFGTLYGVNGSPDRLFVSGNPAKPNYDWYSEQYVENLFCENWYSVLGQDTSAIVGYSIISNRLAAHKDSAEDGRNVIIREGGLSSSNEAQFPIVNTLIGEGAIAPRSHSYLWKEPLFLTNRGIYAITSEDISGDKFSQTRSYYINSKLIQEENLDKAYAVVHNDFYMLFINNKVYCLDGLQRTYNKDEPYSSYQYEGYLLTDIPARVAWSHDNKLYFGTSDGKICEFYTDKNAVSSYNDNGQAIQSYWDTPYITGKVRYTKKDFKYLAITLAPASTTGVKAYGKVKGLWQELFSDFATAKYFDFGAVDFSEFTFNTDTSPINIHKKIWLGIVDKTQFRFENNELNNPFGIYDVTLDFEELGKF